MSPNVNLNQMIVFAMQMVIPLMTDRDESVIRERPGEDDVMDQKPLKR